MKIDWFQLNYFNTLLYPVSVNDCPSNECVILGILFGDLTSKSALLLLTLLSARERLKSTYFFILHQGKLLSVVVFISLFCKRCYFVHILILYTNINMNFFLIYLASQKVEHFLQSQINQHKIHQYHLNFI